VSGRGAGITSADLGGSSRILGQDFKYIGRPRTEVEQGSVATAVDHGRVGPKR